MSRGRHGGRRRSASLKALNGRLLASATDLFLHKGYAGASMDAIAARARVSKRTLYCRYRDKTALFEAVLYEMLTRLSPIEPQGLQAAVGLEPALCAVARHLIGTTLTPKFLRMHRLITCEAYRRPEFGRCIDNALRRPGVCAIADTLQRFAGEAGMIDIETAAGQFWDLTVSSALRVASLGLGFRQEEVEKRARLAVDVFLSGIRRRDTSPNDRHDSAPSNHG